MTECEYIIDFKCDDSLLETPIYWQNYIKHFPRNSSLPQAAYCKLIEVGGHYLTYTSFVGYHKIKHYPYSENMVGIGFDKKEDALAFILKWS